MPLASPATDELEYQFHIAKTNGGRVSCVSSAATSIIRMDRSQERAVPEGAELLDTFLDAFEAREDVSAHLAPARAAFAEDYSAGGAPVTLRLLRLRAGLSQKDVAARMGTSQAAISEYESRSRKPAEDGIRGLASALDVDFNTLMEALNNG